MARDISRPSLTAVTLQELLRRYFAINVRVSRSSSTTRMLGEGLAMSFVCPRFGPKGEDFCFWLFPNVFPQHPATTGSSYGKVPLRPLTIPWRDRPRNPANPRSHHDLDFGGLRRQLPVTAAKAAAGI